MIIKNYLKKMIPYLGWGLLLTFFFISAMAYVMLIDDKLKKFQFPYYYGEKREEDLIEFFKNIYKYALSRNFNNIFLILRFFMIYILLVFSFRFQLRKIRGKCQNKKQLNDEKVSLKYVETITIKNKHKFLSNLIYLLTRFAYHLGSAILLLFYYRYVLFSIDKISNFVLKKITFNLKTQLFSLFYPITNSLYTPLKYSSKSIIIFSWLLSLALVFLSSEIFLKKIFKKDFFVETRPRKIITKEKLLNALSLALLVIAFIFFLEFCYDIIFYLKTKKELELYRSLATTILNFNGGLNWFIFVYIYTLPILTILFYCTSSRLRDLKMLLKEIVKKFRKV